MDGVLIATTQNADLQALGTGGQLAVHAWEQITGYLARKHGAAHAALLAEPNPDPARGVTDWYAEGEGTASPLDSLPPDQQAAARSWFTTLYNDIRADVDALRQSKGEGDRFLADLLSLALITPSTDCLRVLDGRPVLIAWGHAPLGAAASPEMLIGHLEGRVTPPARARAMRILGPPPVVTKRPWGLIGAALGLLLLLSLLLLLLLFDPFRWLNGAPPVCIADPKAFSLLDELRQEEAHESLLRERMARMMLDLGDRRANCPIPPAPPPPRQVERPPPPPPAPNNDVNRAVEQGGKKGRIQVVLGWEDGNDLDLGVVCPNRQVIFFNNRRACGGELDLDQNVFSVEQRPVENIVFPDDPPPGTYRIVVKNNNQRVPGGRASAFRVTVRQEGQPDRVLTGEAPFNQEITVGEFQVLAR
jgi:hypothetical protein